MNPIIDLTFTCILVAGNLMIGNPQKMVPLEGPFIYSKVEFSPYMSITSIDGKSLGANNSGLLMELPSILHDANVVEVLNACEDMALSNKIEEE